MTPFFILTVHPQSRSALPAYKVADVYRSLDLSRAQLTLLGIVSKNDYTSNLTRLGVATNYKIAKSLGENEPDAQALVALYLNHPDIVAENGSPARFEAAVRVFACRKFTAPAEQTPNAQPEPSDPASQNAADEDEAQQPADLQSILSRLQTPRTRPKENMNSSYTVQEEEPLVVFNRCDTVDRPPEQRALDSQQIVRLSSKVKRTCQIAIDQYVEALAIHHIKEEAEKDDNTDKDDTRDKEELPKKRNNQDDEDNEGDEGNKKSLELEDRHLQLLCPGFSDKDLADFGKDDLEHEPATQRPIVKAKDVARQNPAALGIPASVCSFIDRASNFLAEMTITGAPVEYPRSSSLRSAAVQLSVELKKHYKDGSIDLCKKIQFLKQKGLSPPNARDFVDSMKTTIENFVLLNRVCESRRSLMPLSTFEDKFVTLSELELSRLFWRDPHLKAWMQSITVEGFTRIHCADEVSQADVGDWLTGATPGELITKLITDIGGYSVTERTRLKNYSRTTSLMPLEEMRAHLQQIRSEAFDPAAYVDGFRLQAIAFKLSELHCVKYKRLPAVKLLPGASPLTYTLGGTDYFLTEIRNVVTTKQDVADL
ncbi:hypothetical protein BGW39_007002 [Mortierella sp. 14UC]|nr:hypothetical protein BGW39_007002 [Mortierella sp. 14UC]